MKELIMTLSLTDQEALGSVRTKAGLQVAKDKDWIWLRGIDTTQGIDSAIRRLPAKNTYELDEQGNLFPVGGITPIGKLQILPWIPVQEFIPVELPTSAMPGRTEQTYALRLVSSREIKEGQALQTTLPVWKEYADAAPEIRLKRLRFAVSEAGEVLIMGTPLPAIPGKEYWMQEDMLLPGGYDFELPWMASLVAGKLNAQHTSIILFTEEGSWQQIPADAFMQATRSAVRLTEGNILHERIE